MRRLVRWLALATLAAMVVGGLAGAWWYREAVVENPGPEFTPEAVRAIIAEESPIYHRDGTTPLGVLFDQEHRVYVSYRELPADWIAAILAAEDDDFFSHPGFDLRHILRAAWQNLRAGRVVAGGSTLTQQTAKNLYYRPDRSFRAKLEELADALRLEAHFTKEEILEFYANQFHVSGNGRGLGIAARYFFDKTPDQLTTKECAFLAGLVKAPATYNPFVGGTEARRAAAREAAEARTAYVLRRMLEEGAIDPRRYEALAAEPLVFKRGHFQYDRSVVLDAVERELESPVLLELFDRLGIDSPSTAGLRVITTLDPVAQREATYALWHHLSELGATLEASAPATWRLADRAASPQEPGVPLAPHTFANARVAGQGADGWTLDVGGRACRLDEAGLERAAGLAARARTGSLSAAPTEADRAAVAEALPVGAVVRVSVREADRCDIELRPVLQGAAVVVEEGVVRAWVGGNDNRDFDRVRTARRQLGSTWKPLVYAAALELGWLPSDLLDNRRLAFPFRDQWYHPRPDHRAEPELPLSLVGARSENLASVWLLAHLTDRLDRDQVSTLARLTDLAPRPDETPETYRVRMRDTEGLVLTADRLDEVAFTRARAEWLAAAPTAGHREDALAVRSLAHGRGWAAERARVLAQARGPERDARLLALGHNLLSLEELVARCLAGEAALLGTDAAGRLACGRLPEGFTPVDPLAPLPPTAEGDLLVDGRLHLSTLRGLRAGLDRHRATLGSRDPYDPEALYDHPDFRVLLGIRYLHHRVRAFGVEVDLPTGLSLPLGAAELPLLDMARLYAGFLDGARWEAAAEGFEAGAVSGLRRPVALTAAPASPSLIAEIRDARGNVLYRATPRAVPVADPAVGPLLGDVLRNVVRVGTGRRAAAAVALGGAPLPLAGKTGTTNDYRNAAFVGVVPRSEGPTPAWGRGYTVATYVGYDDNRPMRRGATRVQGGNGALPVWIGVARGLAEGGRLGPGGWSEYALPEGTAVVPLAEGEGAPAAVVPAQGRRRFAPAGSLPGPAEALPAEGAAVPLLVPPPPVEDEVVEEPPPLAPEAPLAPVEAVPAPPR